MRAEINSVHQGGPVAVEVLLPTDLGARPQWPVLYILPVEGAKNAYGSGMAEAVKADLANRLGVICVWPEFRSVPWYGDHASDPARAHESFILKELIPWVEATYPVQSSREHRWLLGFSKSGWGAYTLFLRHPEVFGYAAAWDAPFAITGEGENWGPLAIKKAMGTQENFSRYIPLKLVDENRQRLSSDRARLVLGGSDVWRRDTKLMHERLTELRIPHTWRPDLNVKHRWDSGWFQPMAEELAELTKAWD